MTQHYKTELTAGKHWSIRLRRGTQLSLKDLKGGANLAMVFYNAELLSERYNAPDTMKCQHTFHLTKGHCLYSDMGRIFASVVEDSLTGHETICGNITSAMVSERYGQRDYQQDRNTWKQNGQDAFLVELAKYGLNQRDLPACINWFSRCEISDNGDILLDDRDSLDKVISLRIEMDCIVIMHTCPHPLLTAETYPDMQIEILLSEAEPMAPDDACLNHCSENKRGFENNRLYYMGYAGK